jgi:hypothetical protein
MQKFSDMEKKYQLKIYLRSRRGYLYVFRHPSYGKVVIWHFNGELKSTFAQVIAEIVEKVYQWVISHKLVRDYVEVEPLKEVGEDYIILPFHKSYSTLSAIEEWDEELIPDELEIMQNILKNELGNPKNEKERIIEDILIKSLLEPSSKTWFYEGLNKFIISEPIITREHLEKWSKISNEHE